MILHKPKRWRKRATRAGPPPKNAQDVREDTQASTSTPPTDDLFLRSLTARTLYVAGALLLLTMAFILTKTGRDALYFQEKGLHDLPKAYMGIAMLALPLSVVVLSLMHAIGPRRARIVLPLGVAGSLAVFHRVAQPGGGPLMTSFFMLVPLAFGVLFSLSWLLAAELLDRAPRPQLRRAYGILGAASMGGGVLGALIAKALAMDVDPQNFILLGSVALAASAAVLDLAQRRFPPRHMAPPSDLLVPDPKHFWTVFIRRYSLALLAAGMIAALVGMLIEFQFYLAAATSGNAGRRNANLFANLYLGLTGAGLFLQVYLIPRLQRAIGVYGCLLVLPLAMLSGTVGLLANASLLTRSLLRIAEGGLKSSIHRTNWEQAYLPLTDAQRVVAKLLVDGLGKHFAEGMAATILYLWLRFDVGDQSLEGQDISWVTYLLLITTTMWLILMRGLGRTLAKGGSVWPPEADMRVDVPLPDT